MKSDQTKAYPRAADKTCTKKTFPQDSRGRETAKGTGEERPSTKVLGILTASKCKLEWRNAFKIHPPKKKITSKPQFQTQLHHQPNTKVKMPDVKYLPFLQSPASERRRCRAKKEVKRGGGDKGVEGSRERADLVGWVPRTRAVHKAEQHQRPQEGPDRTAQESECTEGRLRQLRDWSSDKNDKQRKETNKIRQLKCTTGGWEVEFSGRACA